MSIVHLETNALKIFKYVQRFSFANKRHYHKVSSSVLIAMFLDALQML